MKKEYLMPVTVCIHLQADCELLNATSFNGIGLQDGTEIDWSNTIVPSGFEGTL